MYDILLPDRATSTPPIPLTSFVGREREMETLTDLLGRPDIRLLTLTGPGGIGKTRVVLRAATHVAPTFANGVIFVRLAETHDAALVISTVAQALGIPDTPGQPLFTRLQDFLADKHLLLLLDNLEHLLEAAALLAADLLASCPHLTLLCTSRIRLGIAGEQVMPLEVLSPEAARTLFVARAQTQVPAFVVSNDLIPIVDAICARLDRLPLAIELAAARVRVLPPLALLTRLAQSLDFLTDGPRDAPLRLRDMRHAIAWSHDLLDERGQTLFRRLGVFVGGFTLEGAQAVMGEGADAFDGVSTLVTASLVNPMQGTGDEPRFTMLETIREYALEQLAASGEEPEIRRRHAHYVVTLAEIVWELPDGPVTESWMPRLRTEISNFRVALGWTLDNEPYRAEQLAGALVDYWIEYGSITEGRAWVGRILERNPDASSRYRARCLLAAGWLAMDHGDLPKAEIYLTEAVSRSRDAADARLLILCLMILGKVALKGNDLERARQLFEEGRTLAPTGEPIHMALAIQSLGEVAMAMDDLATAQNLIEDAVAIHQSGSGSVGEAFGHLYLGQVTLARGNHARAAACFRRAFTLFADAGNLRHVPRVLEGLAGAAIPSQLDQAARLLGAAAVLRDQDGWPRDCLEVSAYDQTAEAATTTLGEPAFSAAWDAGRQLSWDEVCTEVTALAEAIADRPNASSPEPEVTHGLTPRELEVLHLVVEGCSNRAIADRLSLSERTIETHVRHILSKMNLESRTAAVTIAVRHGLV